MVSTAGVDENRQRAWVPVAIGLYLLAVAAFGLWLLLDTWSGHFDLALRILGEPDLTAARRATLASLIYAVVGGLLGAVILSFQGLHLYAAVSRTFATSYAGSYLIGPWVAALIALASYALVRGGLLVFGGQSQAAATPASHWAYLSLGVLTGFSWLRVLEKLHSLAAQVFATGTDASTRGAAVPADSPTAQRS